MQLIKQQFILVKEQLITTVSVKFIPYISVVMSYQSTQALIFQKAIWVWIMPLYDEGAFRNPINTSAPEGYNKADMRWAIESHTFVNSDFEQQGLPTINNATEVEIGRIYGNPNLRNMRQVYNTPTLHAFQPYNSEANARNISFFEIAMDFRHDTLTPNDQVWQVKEVFTTISLMASLAMIVPIATLIYRIPFFMSALQKPIIDTKKRTKGSIINLIVVFVITATFAALHIFTFCEANIDAYFQKPLVQ
jgi:hypothetical protein